MLSFKTRLPFDVLPEWKEVRALPQDASRSGRSAIPTSGHELVDAAHHGDYGRAIGAEARKPDYDVMRISSGRYRPTRRSPRWRQRGASIRSSVIIDLALESDFEQFFVQPLDPAVRRRPARSA